MPRSWVIAPTVLLGLVCTLTSCSPDGERVDVLIENGLIVNGVPRIENGEYLGALNGRLLLLTDNR